MPSYSQYLRQMAVLDSDDDIQWITVKGNPVPIKKGENKGDAIKSFFESKTKGEKKATEKRKESANNTQGKTESPKKEKPFMSKKEYNEIKKNAGHIIEKAYEREPKITADLKSIPGIKLVGLDYRRKTEKSAIEKIKRERIEKKEKIAHLSDAEIMGGMWDLVRYTQEVDKDTFVKQATKTLNELKNKGYTVFELKNYWRPEVNGANTAKPNPYRGVNVKLLSPDGQKVELQFNTANNLQVKEKMHQIYDQQRKLDDDSAEWKELNNKSLAISKQYDNPKGVEKLTL